MISPTILLRARSPRPVVVHSPPCIRRYSPLRAHFRKRQGKHVPAFMKPAMTSFSPKLDAHTSAQIMDRRKQHRHQLSLTSTPFAPKNKEKPTTASSGSSKSMEPIHDASNDEMDSMARRAAGFSHDGEQVNMAAVLSGMGAVPKIAQPV